MPSIDDLTGLPEIESHPDSERPLVSMEGWARFEQRARQRRIERRRQAAQTAISERRFDEARASLDELREIDPTLPDLAPLSAQLAAAERPMPKRTGVGRLVVTAAILAAILLGVTWTDIPTPWGSSPSRRPMPASPEPAASPPALAAGRDEPVPAAAEPAPTLEAGSAPPDVTILPGPADDPPPLAEFVRPQLPPPADTSAASPNTSSQTEVRAGPIRAALPTPTTGATDAVRATTSASISATVATMPPPIVGPAPFESQPGAVVENTPPVPVQPEPRPSSPPAVGAAPSAAASAAPTPPRPPAAPAAVDDAGGVRAVINQYRTAYERLDATLARAVWPSVNQAALARAFGDLESQSLNFQGCEIQLKGAAATAVCAGTAEYVPKVGSRAPRVEPRVWNFSLRKAGSAWVIDSVRAER